MDHQLACKKHSPIDLVPLPRCHLFRRCDSRKSVPFLPRLESAPLFFIRVSALGVVPRLQEKE